MSEKLRATTGEFKQIKNFLKARKEVAHARDKPIDLRRKILLGLMTVIPEEIKLSGILENPQRMAVALGILDYQFGLNDRIDFEGAGRTDISVLIEEARNREASAREKLNIVLLYLPETESVQIIDGINTAVQEIEFVEKWIREKRDNNTVGFSDVDRYRNLVNAINNVMVTSTVLGKEKLSHTKRVVNKDTTIDEIEEKYSWVMGDNPLNNEERAVMIMHNMAMAVQIVDDWQGKHIDELLNIPSYASGALKMADGDIKAAKGIIDIKKDEYKAKARVLGLGKVAANGSFMYFANLIGAYSFLTKKARHVGFLRQTLNKGALLREASFMQGKLEKPVTSK